MTQREWQKTFSDNLKSILDERGMNQSQLAAASGLSVSRISDYINCRAVPTVFTLINIAYALDLTVGELVDFGDMVH